MVIRNTIPHRNDAVHGTEQHIWNLLNEVPDPEIPVLSVLDLGIVRGVAIEDNRLIITITPTYSGCPAMDMIAMNIKLYLAEHGYQNINIVSVLSPAWTTDWMTEDGKKKLKEYGIAAPYKISDNNENDVICCPQCNASDTKMISHFGSTPCKALYQCNVCKEPFDYFKCH